jgi:hypothetical protein
MDISRYEKIKHTFKTGDLLLFEGNGFFSSLIKCTTCSYISHIGMVVEAKDIPNILRNSKRRSEDELYLFHSNKGRLPYLYDILTNDIQSGVQLNILKDALINYDGNVYYKKLVKKNKEQINFKRLEELIIDFKRTPYEEDYFQLCCAAYDGPCGQNQMDISQLFCSELVAYIYMKYGIIHNDIGMPSNEFVPKDFEYENWRQYFTLKYSLQEDILISIRY